MLIYFYRENEKCNGENFNAHTKFWWCEQSFSSIDVQITATNLIKNKNRRKSMEQKKKKIWVHWNKRKDKNTMLTSFNWEKFYHLYILLFYYNKLPLQSKYNFVQCLALKIIFLNKHLFFQHISFIYPAPRRKSISLSKSI